MVERPSGKKLTVNELILRKLKETFDRNEDVKTNVNGTTLLDDIVVASINRGARALPRFRKS